jgi:hypothetical protein
MFSRLLLLTVCFFSCLQSFAQAYEPGLLVRSTGDTLRGEIENEFWVEPPTFIRFRSAAGQPSQLFQPRQLRAVRFTEGRYFRFGVLPINHAAQTRLENLPRGNYSQVMMDSVLAEVLVEGPATLLRVALPGAVHYLVAAPNQPVLELSERKYLRQSETGGWSVTDGNNYQSQLLLYFSTCPAASAAGQTAPYTAAGLAAVVQAYNSTCSPAHQPGQNWVKQAAPRRRLSFQGGVLAGVRYNRVETMSGRSTGACVDCLVRPFGGLYAELFQPSRTSAVYGELSVSNFRSQLLTYVGFSPTTGPQYSALDYQALLGTARLGIRFFFPLPHENQFIVGIGYELNRVLTPRLVSNGAPLVIEPNTKLLFAEPTVLPNLTLGWRTGRTTLSADAQIYRSSDYDEFVGNILGSNYAVRLSASYRLGRNPDAAPARPDAKK